MPYPAVPPRRPRRRAWPRWLTLLAIIAIAATAVAALSGRRGTTTGTPSAYTPITDRYGAWDAPANGDYTKADIATLTAQDGAVVIPSAAGGFDIRSHFATARSLVAEANSQGHQVRVFEYFNLSRLFVKAEQGWRPYTDDFQSSWFLHDAAGAPIPIYISGTSTVKPTGYLLDLANPGLRAWIVKTVVAWMHQADYAGIAFDSANPLIATSIDPRLGAPQGTDYNSLLCGSASVAGVSSSCSQVAAWNSGLSEVISQTRTALHKLGDEVLYNGIAPNVLRSSRNLALLTDADGAVNEGFCFIRGGSATHQPQYTSLTADAKIMQTAAAQHKQIFEITNYKKHPELGEYCLAGFLMGYQPGSSYFEFHEGYYSLGTQGASVPERNLALGRPTGTTYQRHGDVLSRTFTDGTVAVNQGTTRTCFAAPREVTAYSGGKAGTQYLSGQCIGLPPHSAVFLLNSSTA